MPSVLGIRSAMWLSPSVGEQGLSSFPSSTREFLTLSDLRFTWRNGAGGTASGSHRLAYRRKSRWTTPGAGWPTGDDTQVLRSRTSGSSLFKNGHRPTEVGNAKNQQRRVRTWLEPAVSVVDVDVGFAESGSRSRQLPRQCASLT